MPFTRKRSEGANFFEQVIWVVKQVPSGRVTTYGAIARYLGSKGAARAVGYALYQCRHQVPAFPAHRVVNSQGLLTGKYHFGDVMRMQQLLQAEGIYVRNNQVQNFEKVLWDPHENLGTIALYYGRER
ncbi:MAG: MGMT family protein [Bacteroidia bacterium]